MSSYYNDAIFGYTSNGTLGADMLNPGAATGETDWGAIISSGIRGAAQGAIAKMTAGAYQSGQLQQQTVARQQQNAQLVWFVIIGGVLFLAAKG